ncbi:TetR family transcriptional regulator [Rhodococcus sp. WB9]|uniref:TetR family transcriptional regulator n=1 Tax=Rhodococcus sp. WB9 TaxID=2594007 RepID=UPI00164300D4
MARAAEQFDRHGYTHAALHEITGVSHAAKGGLYFHFRSERDLARQVSHVGLTRFDDGCTERAAHRAARSKRSSNCPTALVDHGHDDPLICAALRLVLDLGTTPPPHGPPCSLPGPHAAGASRPASPPKATFGPAPTPAPSPRPSSPPHSALACSPGTPTRSPTSHTDEPGRQLLLPAVTEPAALEYFCQFALRREPHRTAPRP